MGFMNGLQDQHGRWLLSQGQSEWQFSTSSSLETFACVLFFAIGVYSVSSYLLSFVRMLMSTFILPGKSLRNIAPRGSYALITGSSDGIGAAYAQALAAKGYNLILVSRTASKLSTLSTNIRTKYPDIKISTLPLDFSTATTTSSLDLLSNLVIDKDISILINNVGLSHSIPVPFPETSDTEISQIIAINCLSTLRVTQLVLPGMLKRRKGLILTMGSFGGLLPTPLLATYSGSKAFLQNWSSALAAELEPRYPGICVHFVHSYLVTSAMSKIKRASWLIPNERDFVKATLAKVGRRGGALGYAWSGTPYWSHAMMEWALLAFVGAYAKVGARVNRGMHEGIRKRALKKAERERAGKGGKVN
ncbi:MAG: hypothetical protein Q9227_007859 [Pyrenula ochraceoflavens]